MNLDTSIYRMAFREADTLGVAQVLVAKKRADLEHHMLLKQINEGSASTGADLERALTDMEQRSDAFVGRIIDRTA
ncbi:hypothetical protein [Devosia sp. Root105]|uniref:hypothetical protein n=1 Tax=Devosia sp. Root105 TaxID=1736423 RepID=UPI0006FD5873|nr:hypothetical protein [Devosia sp. Root105]KQU93426.1 hypothetical protein ASC68_23015 [Devosia sp. Root105]